MKSWRKVLAYVIVVTFLLAPPAFAEPPTLSIDTFVGGSSPLTDATSTPCGNPADQKVKISGTSTIFGQVEGGLLAGASFEATANIKINQCSNTGSFTSTIMLFDGNGGTLDIVIPNGQGTGDPPSFSGGFQASNGSGAFPCQGNGTISGSGAAGPLVFTGLYHFTHGC